MKYISKAVFPVAGLGARFLPATRASLKEMLPIVGKPFIQHAVTVDYALKPAEIGDQFYSFLATRSQS